jgi:hypothetical protein
LSEAPEKAKRNPPNLIAYAKVFETEGQTQVVQIDSHGSIDRKFPQKQIQTLQFGEEAARQLYEILRNTYHFKT